MLNETKQQIISGTDGIKLPESIINLIEGFSDKEIQEGTRMLIDPNIIREYIYLFLFKFNKQIIFYLRGKEIKEITIKSNDRDEYGETTKTIGAKKKVRIYSQIVSFLFNNEIIIQTRTALNSYNLIGINNERVSKGKSPLEPQARAYIINTKLINGNPIDIKFKNNKVLKIHRNKTKELLDKIENSKNAIAKSQLKLNLKFKRLSRAEVYSAGLNLIGEIVKGKIFDMDRLNNHMILFDYLMADRLMTPIISEKSGRVFTSFNLIPSWIRDLFLLDGNKTKGADIKSSIPSILLLKLGGNPIDYNYFVDQYKWSYSKSKLQVLEFIFSNNSKMKNKHKKVYKYFEDFNPGLLSKLILAKKGKGKNKELANKLFSIESDMMTKNIIDLLKIGIEVYYVFDELIGKESDINAIKKVMTKNLILFNIDTVVK